MTLDLFEELLDSAEWLLTDDGEDLCVECAQDHYADIVDAIECDRKDGWYVVAEIAPSEEGLRCCVCDRGEGLEEVANDCKP